MARETKLGMLVGLGFIICFAIILENRGRRDRVAPQMPHRLLTQAQVNPRAGDAVAVEATARRYAEGLNRRLRSEDRPARRGRRPRQPVTPARSVALRPPVAQESAAPVGAALGASPADRQLTATPRSKPRTSPAAATPESSGPFRNLAAQQSVQVASNRPKPMTDQPSTPAVVAQKSAEVKARVLGHYVVQKGDTLSRIAAKRYGSGSKRVIDAIFDANRSMMTSPNDLRSGATIALPAIEGIKLLEATVVQKAAPKKAVPVREQSTYRWYQVRKGDRYATIAKRELGSARRWKEIAELNRDIFPDPSKIRFGVRIRIPIAGDTSGTRSQS
ncbi:MAG: LysM peptidoglycan-binding domain-containing protein [Phycisphaerae bacterium]